jgi:CRP-like cAMP-binding protein
MQRTKKLTDGQIVLLLGKIPFFRAFEMPEKEQLVRHAALYVAKEGEKIVEQGSLDHDFYILLSGTAAVSLEHDAKVIAEMSPGDFFGEISFILNTPRSSHIIANSLCILLQVDRRMLGNLGPIIREKFKDQIIFKLANMVVATNENNAASSPTSLSLT